MQPPGEPERPADKEKTRRYRLHGPIATGAHAPTEAERQHYQARGALAILRVALDREPTFWRDVDSIHQAIADVIETTDPQAFTNPAWTLARSYGVQRDHRTLITAILLTAAREPTRHAARAALLQLGEHPVAVDGPPRGRARHDVTRLVQGARMIAAYRAGRCGAPGCAQPRQGRYCRHHGAQTNRHRQWEEARQWALEHALAALRAPDRIVPGVDYAMLVIRSNAELEGG
jgi:hypothetical protein